MPFWESCAPGKLRTVLGLCGELMGHVGVFLSASLEDGTPGGSCLLCACNPVFSAVRVGIPGGRGSAFLLEQCCFRGCIPVHKLGNKRGKASPGRRAGGPGVPPEVSSAAVPSVLVMEGGW